MRVVVCLTLLSVLVAFSSPVDAQIDARMLRQPDVSADKIAFVHAGDIWIAPKTGGTAQRLSTPMGEESFPRFSPDGSQIAFSGNYDGNTDIYIVPADGGLPIRLTHHPAADRMVDWYPDGKSILYATLMTSARNRFNQLYKISKDGGLPEKLPIPYGEFGAISSDGKTLAYEPISVAFRTWKRYRGGMNPDIWTFNLDDFSSENITESDAEDSQPMWHGEKLYFLSDRDANKRSNIWMRETKSGKPRQITFFEDLDVHFPSIGPSDIVFETGGRLYLLDLATDKYREVEIKVVTDRATLKPRPENVSKVIQTASLSPTGKRVMLEARGEIFSAPAENGPVMNLTRSSGVAERFPAWSPDGKSVAYFSDRAGEYELTIRPADGKGEEKTITKLGAGFRYRPSWSPDSKRIVFIDQTMAIRMVEVESGKVTDVDRLKWAYHGELSAFAVSWSADSRWLAYAKDSENRNRSIVIMDSQNGEHHQVTSDFYNQMNPVFDPEGKYLYFLADRTFAPSYGDEGETWIYANVTNIAAVPLKKDIPSPLAPKNDDESSDDKKKTDEEKKKEEGAKKDDDSKKNDDEKKADNKEKEKPKPVEIDFDDFERRIVILPPAAGNYGMLNAVAGKVLYQRRPRTGSDARNRPVVAFDLKEREEQEILDDVDGYRISADGKKLLAFKDLRFAVVEIKPKQKMEKFVPTGDLETTIDPVAEWKQIFTDAWRIERDFFYDPGMHGVDWPEMRKRYGKLLEDAVTRWDVNYVIGELISELNSSHTYRSGGDLENEARRSVGLLGADFALENGAYRIKRIIRGAPWDTEARSPLAEPGLNIKEGDYLLAVNGAALDPAKDPWAAFQGLADRTVTLTVNDKPERANSREVIVKTVSDDMRLRNLAWIESNRSRVEAATQGRVGYVYVPDTGIGGQTELFRQYLAQFHKPGLIIDERFNSGGQIPDRFVELMNRPLTNYYGVRDGHDWQWPPHAHLGAKVMLMNGWSGSGGDCFPFLFKRAGLGPLIGTRTWGGLIGMTGCPPLIDGGNVTVPTFGIYGTDGKWIIEGEGVHPDIEVVDDPTAMAKGKDPQLEKAIEETLRLLKKKPPTDVKKPPYPKRSGK